MKILKYILTTIISILILCSTENAIGQQSQKKKKPTRNDNFFHMEGIRIGTVVSMPFQSLWNKGDRYGVEGNVEFELKPNLYPVAEIGWEKKKMNQDYINYNSSGSYLRFGINYNLLEAESRQEKDILYIGCRYGLSYATQQIESYKINDSYWNVNSGSFPSQNYHCQWAEIVLGLKGEITKNFYMGWAIHYKVAILKGDLDMPMASFAPGYGNIENGSTFNFSYSIAYNIPFRIGTR